MVMDILEMVIIASTLLFMVLYMCRMEELIKDYREIVTELAKLNLDTHKTNARLIEAFEEIAAEKDEDFE